jgi:hypothetical protein
MVLEAFGPEGCKLGILLMVCGGELTIFLTTRAAQKQSRLSLYPLA